MAEWTKKIDFSGEEFSLVENGVFRSPYFDWKENPKELIVHFWIAANEKEAQKAGTELLSTWEIHYYCRWKEPSIIFRQFFEITR